MSWRFSCGWTITIEQSPVIGCQFLLSERVTQVAPTGVARTPSCSAVDGIAAATIVESLFLVEVEYRVALIEAERQFIEEFVRRVKEDADYVKTWRGFHAGARPAEDSSG